MNQNKTFLIAYIPVLHAGYEKFLKCHFDVSEILIFGKQTTSSFDWLRKDLRCLNPEQVVKAIRSWNIGPKVRLLEEVLITELWQASNILMPDETESHIYAESVLSGVQVSFESVALRYDKKKTESVEAISAEEVSTAEALSMMQIAFSEAQNSPDWWLQVGGVIARDGEVLLVGHNEHKPNEREAVFMGDPRSNYGRGLNIELSVADHAEAVLVGEAARLGVSLSGTDMYVTTFPCPPCSRLLARVGIKRLFFQKGYAMLDGDALLRSAGVEIFHISM